MSTLVEDGGLTAGCVICAPELHFNTQHEVGTQCGMEPCLFGAGLCLSFAANEVCARGHAIHRACR